MNRWYRLFRIRKRIKRQWKWLRVAQPHSEHDIRVLPLRIKLHTFLVKLEWKKDWRLMRDELAKR